jgi:Acetoacetate decarboxylase (ADC)
MPPRYGKLDVAAWSGTAPFINGYKTEPWTLKGAQILECRHEIDDEPADALLPPALHPAMPAYATFAVMRFAESPVGPFSLGEVRVVGRAGGRPVAFVLCSFCDSEAARRELAARWGFPVSAGEISLRARHYEVSAEVRANGKPVLELGFRNRRPLPATHIQPLPGMNLARNREDQRLALVQVDFEAVFAQSDSGSELIIKLDPEAIPAGQNLKLINPMSVALATADLTVGRIELLCDPEHPAETSTSFVDH